MAIIWLASLVKGLPMEVQEFVLVVEVTVQEVYRWGVVTQVV